MSLFRNIAAGVTLGLTVVFAAALPASAHDELVASVPESDARLSAAPDKITMTFSAEPLSLDGAGVAVIVTDADGRDWVAETPTVVERTVTAALKPEMPDAGYEVRWRIVSSDGHPLSGVIPFTLGDSEPLALSAATTPESPTGITADTSRSDAQVQEQSAQESQQILRLTLLGAGGALVALAVYVVITIFRRRGRDASGTPTP